MKLPRWLVACMLTTSAVAVMAASAWWWVALPQQTIREFTTPISFGGYAERERIVLRYENWAAN